MDLLTANVIQCIANINNNSLLAKESTRAANICWETIDADDFAINTKLAEHSKVLEEHMAISKQERALNSHIDDLNDTLQSVQSAEGADNSALASTGDSVADTVAPVFDHALSSGPDVNASVNTSVPPIENKNSDKPHNIALPATNVTLVANNGHARDALAVSYDCTWHFQPWL